MRKYFTFANGLANGFTWLHIISPNWCFWVCKGKLEIESKNVSISSEVIVLDFGSELFDVGGLTGNWLLFALLWFDFDVSLELVCDILVVVVGATIGIALETRRNEEILFGALNELEVGINVDVWVGELERNNK